MFSSQPYIIKGPRSDKHVCDWITVKMITSIIIDIKEYSLLLHWPHKYTMLIAYPLATYMTSHKSQLHHSFPVGTDQIPSLLPPQFVQRLIASVLVLHLALLVFGLPDDCDDEDGGIADMESLAVTSFIFFIPPEFCCVSYVYS